MLECIITAGYYKDSVGKIVEDLGTTVAGLMLYGVQVDGVYADEGGEIDEVMAYNEQELVILY